MKARTGKKRTKKSSMSEKQTLEFGKSKRRLKAGVLRLGVDGHGRANGQVARGRMQREGT
jgi:hypothetical protein